MLVLPGKVHDLGDLRLGYLIGIDPADANSLLMHMKHDARGLFAALVEKALQHVHDELHRRVVVVQQQNLVQAGLLGLRPSLGDEARLALFITPRAVLAGHPSRSLSSTVPAPRSAAVGACRPAQIDTPF